MTRAVRTFAGPVLLALTLAGPVRAEVAPPAGTVAVELLEGVSDKMTWDFKPPAPAERYTEAGFGFVTVPRKFSSKGLVLDRSNPLVLRAAATVTLPAGEYRFLLRARGAARLWLGDKVILQTNFLKANSSGDEAVPETPATVA